MARKKKTSPRDPLTFTPSPIKPYDVEAEFEKAGEKARREGWSTQRAANRSLPSGQSLLVEREETKDPSSPFLPLPRRAGGVFVASRGRLPEESESEYRDFLAREKAGFTRTERGGRGPGAGTSILQKEERSTLIKAAQEWERATGLKRSVEDLNELYQVGEESVPGRGKVGRFIQIPESVSRRGKGAIETYLLMEVGAPEGVSIDEFRVLARQAAERGPELERMVRRVGGGDRPLPGLRAKAPAQSIITSSTGTRLIDPKEILNPAIVRILEQGTEILNIPAAQKYSVIKRDYERTVAMKYDQMVDYWQGQGFTEAQAKKFAGEALDRSKKFDLTREQLDVIAARPWRGREGGVVVRKGTGGKARKGSVVAKEAAALEREVRQMARQGDRPGTGLPRVLTRTGPSIFTSDEGSFDPGQAGRERRVSAESRTAAPATLTRSQEAELRRERRAQRYEEQATGRGGGGRATLWVSPERKAEYEAMKEAAKDAPRLWRSGTKPKGVSGLGELNTKTIFAGAIMLGLIGAGAYMVIKTLQAEKASK